jgi:hypothetical protein
MKNTNILNKIYSIIAIVIVVFILSKIYNYEIWNRYYYTASICTPKLFPVNVLSTHFLSKDESIIINKSDDYLSNWGENFYGNSNQPKLLPEKLYIQYLDYRTKKYYEDTIVLPKEDIQKTLEYIEKKGLMNQYKKKSFALQIGIANNGNVLFWLTTDYFQTEYHRVKLNSKPLGKEDVYKKTGQYHIEDLFDNMHESLKLQIDKDSIYIIEYKYIIPDNFSDFINQYEIN